MTERKKILIVEDDVLIAMELEDELSDLGYDPMCATSVDVALELVKHPTPMFAILDMHVRKNTSFDLARYLKANCVPFVFVSGNDVSSLPEDLRSSKVLTKPINFDELSGLLACNTNG